jgi:Zn-dependent peptidase ImmA (M78 family)
MQFERGFKSWTERVALSLRDDLGLPPDGALDPQQLAEYLSVRIVTPYEISGMSEYDLKQLIDTDPWGWSAVSISQGKFSLIIYNPRHSKARQASDIMHELAHLILDHSPATLIPSLDGKFVMRSYNEAQENEANWLAWALLLPRDVLIRCKKRALSPAQIAQNYGVSEKLVNFRLRVTGVEVHLRAVGRRWQKTGSRK